MVSKAELKGESIAFILTWAKLLVLSGFSRDDSN